MDPSKIINELGGTSAVAKLCRVKPPSVSGWRKNGIPDAREQFLRLLRPDVWGDELRPDVFGQAPDEAEARDAA